MEKTSVIISNCQLTDMNSNQEFRINGETIFGRSEGHRTYPNDTKMSRKHFRLVLTEDVVLIEDLGSTNQTQVNGKKLRPNTLYKMRSRDLIAAGNQKFQIVIDGKIVPDTSTTLKTQSSPDGTGVIERFIAAPEETTKARLERPGEIKGEIVGFAHEVGTKIQNKDDDALVISMSKDQKVAWYLQFEGSEFGPISFVEMERVVKHQHFQGGRLYVWAQGLSNWTPISTEHAVFNPEPTAPTKIEDNVTTNVEVERGRSLVATVNCLVEEDGLKRKLAATCEEISASKIRILCKEVMPSDGTIFHIEVVPLKSSGLPKFLAKVKRSSDGNKKNIYTLDFLGISEADLVKVKKYIAAQKI